MKFVYIFFSIVTMWGSLYSPAFAYTDSEIVALATEYWNRPAKICLELEQTIYQIDSKRRLVKVQRYTNCKLRDTDWVAERLIKGQWISRNTLYIERFIKNLHGN